MKAHIFRELVNDLRDIAKQFHGHDSLRDRISRRLRKDVQPGSSDALISQLIAVATGDIPHDYNGECPDSQTGAGSRDHECPACQILIWAAQKQPKGRD